MNVILIISIVISVAFIVLAVIAEAPSDYL